MKTVNETGLQEIREFLATNHISGGISRGEHFTTEMISAWARDAELQMSEGNPPTIEISSGDSVNGQSMQYTISAAGIDDDSPDRE
jgi:hypothetical protein